MRVPSFLGTDFPCGPGKPCFARLFRLSRRQNEYCLIWLGAARERAMSRDFLLPDLRPSRRQAIKQIWLPPEIATCWRRLVTRLGPSAPVGSSNIGKGNWELLTGFSLGIVSYPRLSGVAGDRQRAPLSMSGRTPPEHGHDPTYRFLGRSSSEDFSFFCGFMLGRKKKHAGIIAD